MSPIEFLSGKSVLLRRLAVETIDHQLILTLDAEVAGQQCRIVCENVSSLRIEDVSYPMQISGLSVTDRAALGWQADVRYEVRDYEDDQLRFFCQEITINA